MRVYIFLVAFAVPGAAAHAADCSAGPAASATANATSIETLAFAPFHRPEIGWATYAPHIAVTIGSACPFVSPGFAAALARWQAAHKLPATGVVDVESFAAMNGGWTLARPFVRATRDGACPEPPGPEALATVAPGESYGGKTIQLRRDALDAWRAMVTAARRAVPAATAKSDWLRIYSGFRAPIDDDLRCAIENNCSGVARATCSAHRTGTAIDAYVGHAPGLPPDSSDAANRRAMSRTAAYRWLVANARRFGFANYVFEPWHWEYVGPARAPGTRTTITRTTVTRTTSTRPPARGMTPE